MTIFARNTTWENCSEAVSKANTLAGIAKARILVLLDGDVAEAFPNDEAVNEALRLVIKLTKVPRSEERSTE